MSARLVLVPSLLHLILECEGHSQQRSRKSNTWVSSGEALPLHLARRFQQRLPSAILLNLYGSSEVAADATCYEVQASESLTSIPIGKPIDNTRAYILNGNMQLMPIGAIGRLSIGGDGLALGYFNRAELTGGKIRARPF